MHIVARHFRNVDNRILLDRLVIDEVVELSGEHGLDEMLSIGHDNTISVDGTGGIGAHEPDGEKLEGMGGVKERRVSRGGVV